MRLAHILLLSAVISSFGCVSRVRKIGASTKHHKVTDILIYNTNGVVIKEKIEKSSDLTKRRKLLSPEYYYFTTDKKYVPETTDVTANSVFHYRYNRLTDTSRISHYESEINRGKVVGDISAIITNVENRCYFENDHGEFSYINTEVYQSHHCHLGGLLIQGVLIIPAKIIDGMATFFVLLL